MKTTTELAKLELRIARARLSESALRYALDNDQRTQEGLCVMAEAYAIAANMAGENALNLTHSDPLGVPGPSKPERPEATTGPA